MGRNADLNAAMPEISRRAALGLLAGIPAALVARKVHALDAGMAPRHGLSSFGELAYPESFANFSYVNPSAPVGGTLSFLPSQWVLNQNPRTFNTFNSYVLEGDAPPLMELTFASLMVRAYDEPDAVYGMLALDVRHDAARRVFEFTLDPMAVFHDGTPLTAEDVVFSFETLRQDGHPMLATSLRLVEACTAPSRHVVRVEMKDGSPRDVILSFASDIPVLSKAYYSKVKFKNGTLTPPLGSGPFKIETFEPGRFVDFRRVGGWWGWKRPSMRGQYNWDRIRIEFYRDHDVAFEAFKSGQYFLREEFSSRIWATSYTFPALSEDKVKQTTIPDHRPSGMQGFFINMRRDKFKDPRVREALGLMFDFEWANKNLFYGSYQRTQSPFQNSTMMAAGPPPPDELALLEPFRGRIPDSAFGDAVMQAVSDGSGRDRTLIRRAMQIMEKAGVKRQGSKAYLPDGSLFTLEILNDNPGFDKIILPYLQNLKAIGIDASLRNVDSAQFQQRTNEYDFDLVTQRYGLTQTPGDGLRRVFSSKDADRPGTYNLSGLKHPVVDELIEKIITANDRAVMELCCRVLDRVLRSLHFWVPQWFKDSHSLAYWDIYDAPPKQPLYSSGVLETWWVDSKRAKKLGKGL